ncbi:hypothetical protein ACF082_18680 [Streptomyces lydicus]|uniref:hypothetical protein n=1 Tax=Streptomyces lydicus TaxID=47763 RepID=UPI0036F7AEA8
MADSLVPTTPEHDLEHRMNLSHTTLRHARKATAAIVIAVAAFGLTACQDGGANAAKSPASAHATQSPASTGKTAQGSAQGSAQGAGQGSAKGSGQSAAQGSAQGAAKGGPTGAPKKSGARCTDQINYTGDPRPNAEINSLGAKTGHCPAPQKGSTSPGTPKKPGVRCTDQINYAGDPRPNADLNSIGEETGYCPTARQQ